MHAHHVLGDLPSWWPCTEASSPWTPCALHVSAPLPSEHHVELPQTLLHFSSSASASPLALPRSDTTRGRVRHGRSSRASGHRCSFASGLPPPEATAPPRLSHLAAPLELLASPVSPPQLTIAGASAAEPPVAEPPVAVAGPPRVALGRATSFCGCVLAMSCPSATARRQCHHQPLEPRQRRRRRSRAPACHRARG
jgi:hypothetical protein